MSISLTWPEFIAAAHVGLTRFIASRSSGLNAATTYQSNWHEQLGRETLGAAAEMVVAKSLDTFYSSGVGTYHDTPDVGEWEVRATHMEDGCLILRDNDPDDRKYVLVVGKSPNTRIAGWCTGAEGKQVWNIRDPHGERQAWFVKQRDLHEWRVGE